MTGISGVDINIKGYGKGGVYVQGKYTPSKQTFSYEVGLDAIVGGFSGVIKASGWTVFDQKIEMLLLTKSVWLKKDNIKIYE